MPKRTHDYNDVFKTMKFKHKSITHITNGNKNEERLVNIMGGTVFETASERSIRIGEERGEKRGEEKGRAQTIVEFAQEIGWSNDQILNRLQEKLQITLEKAKEYLNQFSKPLA